MLRKKKETSAENNKVVEAEEQAKMRLEGIKAFNTQNAGKYFIDPVKIPTDDDIAQAKKDCEDFAAEVAKKEYFIADKENAVRVATFLKNWLSDGFWTQRFFVGVLNFNELLDEFLKSCEEEPKDFILDYGPMQFCFLMLENYAGIGIESAKKMAEKYEEYIPIYNIFNEHVNWYKKQQDHAQELNQRYSMFQQGYWYEILPQTPDTVEDSQNASTSNE